tara:strand:- start:155 stop:958 length:804 start_codon:yes stop_codon:yes gene_type:complete
MRKRVYYDGSLWLQNNGKVLTVVSKVKGDLFLVKFEDSPEFTACGRSIKKGNVRDLNDPLVYGAVCHGYGPFTAKVQGKHTPEYEVWRGVVRRCYDTKSPNYHLYGGAGVTLCKDWHNFQIFAKWYTNLPLYGRGLHLDKDLLNKEANMYAPSNCTLVPQSINSLFTGGFKSIVHMNARKNKWVVQMQMGEKCLNGNKRQSYFGEYYDRDEAIEVYFENKIKHVISVANKEKENLDERVYLNLINPTWIREYIEELTLSHKDNGVTK